jgi:hypothetical protein
MVELEPSSASYIVLAAAEFDAGNPRAAYAAALRAVSAARRERSFYRLLTASDYATACVQRGALGPTCRWSQAAPFLDNMEEALPRLKRWMPPAMMDHIIGGTVTRMQEWQREYAHSDRRDNLIARRVPPAPVVAAAVANCRAWCRELQVLPPSGPQPRPDLPHRTCASCGKKALQMHRCSRCKAAFYCGAACQKRHWREHKAACEAACGAAAGT